MATSKKKATKAASKGKSAVASSSTKAKAKKSASTSSKTTASRKKDGQDILKMLGSLGINSNMLESMVGNWRNQLSSKLTNTIEETDLREAFERAREVTDGSVDRVKEYSKKNPTMFFSGLAAVLMGAGLLAAAGRQAAKDDEK